MVKKIDFPANELSKLQGQNRIVTTRVSREYGRYHVGDLVLSPWQEVYSVDNVQKITAVKEHPYYQHLTQEQVQFLCGYKRIEVITLKKVKTS